MLKKCYKPGKKFKETISPLHRFIETGDRHLIEKIQDNCIRAVK